MNDCLRRWTVAVVFLMGTTASCARMPYTTKTVHEDFRVAVAVQKEIAPTKYSHPAQLTADQIAAVLRNFSLREEQRLPLRWLAEEVPPKPVFREEELVWVSPYLVEALQKAGPDERAHFQLFAPGQNRADTRNVTAGWVAVREPFLYVGIEYFH